jgi:hypothetical protein
MLDNVSGITGEKPYAIATQPSAAMREPSRIGEMVQSYDRFQAASFQGRNDRAVVL